MARLQQSILLQHARENAPAGASALGGCACVGPLATRAMTARSRCATSILAWTTALATGPVRVYLAVNAQLDITARPAVSRRALALMARAASPLAIRATTMRS